MGKTVRHYGNCDKLKSIASPDLIVSHIKMWANRIFNFVKVARILEFDIKFPY